MKKRKVQAPQTRIKGEVLPYMDSIVMCDPKRNVFFYPFWS